MHACTTYLLCCPTDSKRGSWDAQDRFTTRGNSRIDAADEATLGVVVEQAVAGALGLGCTVHTYIDAVPCEMLRAAAPLITRSDEMMGLGGSG